MHFLYSQIKFAITINIQKKKKKTGQSVSNKATHNVDLQLTLAMLDKPHVINCYGNFHKCEGKANIKPEKN